MRRALEAITGFSRKKVIRSLLALPGESDPSGPGIILIQVDALSRAEFERAVAQKRMPFLARLLSRDGYTLHSLYSGLPSTTPAVQGELMHGQPCAVPSFDFVDRVRGRYGSMLDPRTAAEVEQRLEAQGEGIAADGSTYSDVYRGAAAEAHFCAAHLGWGEVFARAGLWRLAVIVLLHFTVMVRIVVLALVEFGLALWDAARGMWAGCDLRHEVTMLFARMFISIVLREWITLGVQVDAIRGLPVIHANFLGYDEQCHRRGPGSYFARWSLKGIDGSIHRIWSTAHRAAGRRYHLWVYSDHGQERTVPYAVQTGRSLRAAVEEVLEDMDLALQEQTAGDRRDASPWRRGHWLPPGGKKMALSSDGEEARLPYLTHKGPVAHLYLPEGTPVDAVDQIAHALISHAQIPLAMRADGDGALAWVRRGRFRLPDGAAEVLGTDHPFLGEAGVDLVRLAHHEWAGDLVLAGWERDQAPALSFSMEYGAHGGPGPAETHAFALLPRDAPVDLAERSYLRPRSLYDAILRARPARAAR